MPLRVIIHLHASPSMAHVEDPTAPIPDNEPMRNIYYPAMRYLGPDEELRTEEARNFFPTREALETAMGQARWSLGPVRLAPWLALRDVTYPWRSMPGSGGVAEVPASKGQGDRDAAHLI